MRFLSLLRLRLRVSFDELVTVGVTLLAIGLAVGYQVLGRWIRSHDTDPPSS